MRKNDRMPPRIRGAKAWSPGGGGGSLKRAWQASAGGGGGDSGGPCARPACVRTFAGASDPLLRTAVWRRHAAEGAWGLGGGAESIEALEKIFDWPKARRKFWPNYLSGGGGGGCETGPPPPWG